MNGERAEKLGEVTIEKHLLLTICVLSG